MAVWGDGICSDGEAGGCAGEIFPRLALSGSGDSYYRCDRHYALYSERMEAVNADVRRRYPVRAPSDFDPDFAGEVWDSGDW